VLVIVYVLMELSLSVISFNKQMLVTVRQRQYFEQKRRQQQGPELHNQNVIAGGQAQASNDQEPRSLDVLNINNLATPKNHHGESASEFPICFRGLSEELYFLWLIISPF